MLVLFAKVFQCRRYSIIAINDHTNHNGTRTYIAITRRNLKHPSPRSIGAPPGALRSRLCNIACIRPVSNNQNTHALEPRGDDLQYVACRVKITTNDLRHKRRLNQRLNVSINEFNVLPFGMKLKASLSI